MVASISNGKRAVEFFLAIEEGTNTDIANSILAIDSFKVTIGMFVISFFFIQGDPYLIDQILITLEFKKFGQVFQIHGNIFGKCWLVHN